MLAKLLGRLLVWVIRNNPDTVGVAVAVAAAPMIEELIQRELDRREALKS